MKKLLIGALLFTLTLLTVGGVIFGVKIVPVYLAWRQARTHEVWSALYIIVAMFFVQGILILFTWTCVLLFEIIALFKTTKRPLYFVFGYLSLNPFLIIYGIKYNKLNSNNIDN